MRITLTIPDDLIESLRTNGRDIERVVLESIAIEGYRSGKLTHAQVGRMLNLETSIEVENFLSAASVYDPFDEADAIAELDRGRQL